MLRREGPKLKPRGDAVLSSSRAKRVRAETQHAAEQEPWSRGGKRTRSMRFSGRSIVALSTVAFLVTSSPRASADEWYGYQTLAVDGAAATLLVAGLVSPAPVRKVLLPLSLATYLAASPLVHAAHQRGDVGVGALGLRIVAPLGLGVVGLLVGASGRDSSWGAPLVGGLLGVALGVITAVVIDAAALARETQKPAGQMATSLSLGPSVFLPFGGVF